MVNPSCAVPQECEVTAFEERGSQETIPTQMPGYSEVNNIKQGFIREKRCTPKDIEGSKVEDEGRYSCASERESSFSKFPKKTPLAVDLDIACVKGGFCSVDVDSPGRNTDFGYHFKREGGVED